MAKLQKRLDGSDEQTSLFDLLLQEQKERRNESDAGSMNVENLLRESITAAIKSCPLSRWEIAGRMSHLLNLEISKYQIDSWTSDAKDGHRFPAAYLPAFCRATENIEPLRVLTDAYGVFVLPGPDTLRSEVQRLDEEARKILTEKKWAS